MSDCHPADAPCDPDWKCRTHLGVPGAEPAVSEMLADERCGNWLPDTVSHFGDMRCAGRKAHSHKKHYFGAVTWNDGAGEYRPNPTTEVAASEALTATEFLRSHQRAAGWQAIACSCGWQAPAGEDYTAHNRHLAEALTARDAAQRAAGAQAVVERVEALAAEYERDAKDEPHGGELWSTTAEALRATLTKHVPTEVIEVEGMPFVRCSCDTSKRPQSSVWLQEHWQGDQASGVAAIRDVVAWQARRAALTSGSPR